MPTNRKQRSAWHEKKRKRVLHTASRKRYKHLVAARAARRVMAAAAITNSDDSAPEIPEIDESVHGVPIDSEVLSQGIINIEPMPASPLAPIDSPGPAHTPTPMERNMISNIVSILSPARSSMSRLSPLLPFQSTIHDPQLLLSPIISAINSPMSLLSPQVATRPSLTEYPFEGILPTPLPQEPPPPPPKEPSPAKEPSPPTEPPQEPSCSYRVTRRANGRGRKAAYPPRRPGRVEKQQQERARGKSSAESLLRFELQQIREVAQRMQPNSPGRRRPTPNSPDRTGPPPTIDQVLLAEKETPSARLQYRLSHSKELTCDDITKKAPRPNNKLISEELIASLLHHCIITCKLCKSYVILTEKRFSNTVVGHCQNEDCMFSELYRDNADKLGFYYVTNLSICLESLLDDSGYAGMSRMCYALGLNPFSANSYYRHCTVIYFIMNKFYKDNLHKAHADVKSFFFRNFQQSPDYDAGEYLDLYVSLDGAFSHIKDAESCTSFICEVMTGRIIDYHTTYKCFKCDNSTDMYDNYPGSCPYNLYHGSPGSMEINNAIILFGRSQQYGFVYSHYVSDGDAKVFPHLLQSNPYETKQITKIECANHVQKRASGRLFKFGKWFQTYVGEPGVKGKKNGGKGVKKSNGTKNTAKNGTKKTQIQMGDKDRETGVNGGKQGNTMLDYLTPRPRTRSQPATPPQQQPSDTPQPTLPRRSSRPRASPSQSLSQPEISILTQPESGQSLAQPEPTTHPRRSSRIMASQPHPSPQHVQSEEPSPSPSTHVQSEDPTSQPQPSSSSQPDPPAIVLPKMKQRGKTAKYALRVYFTWGTCIKAGRKYRMAVYSNRKDGVVAQSKAVEALPYHELDYPEANYIQRLKFHQRCSSSWCNFSEWLSKGNKPEDYTRTTAKDCKGKTITWDGGIYQGMDILFPEAFLQLVEIYKDLGSTELMERCSTMATQNINESIHSKLRIIVKKLKKHSNARVNFACQAVFMKHNFGHFESSLCHFLGSMTTKMARALRHDDYMSMYNAARKHEVKAGAQRSHRLKRRTRQVSTGPAIYDDEYAPGEEDLNPIFIDPEIEIDHDIDHKAGSREVSTSLKD